MVNLVVVMIPMVATSCTQHKSTDGVLTTSGSPSAIERQLEVI